MLNTRREIWRQSLKYDNLIKFNDILFCLLKIKLLQVHEKCQSKLLGSCFAVFFLWTENSLVLHSLVKDAMKAFDDFQNKPQKSME